MQRPSIVAAFGLDRVEDILGLWFTMQTIQRVCSFERMLETLVLVEKGQCCIVLLGLEQQEKFSLQRILVTGL